MKVVELTQPNGSDFASQVLQDRLIRGRQVALTFTALGAAHAALVALLQRFDAVVATGTDQVAALVPQAALALLAAASPWPEVAAALEAISAKHAVWWQAGRFSFNVTQYPLVYGILNVTPDSFYDGGQFVTLEATMKQVAKMVTAGVDVVEVGGQTTRPGFTPITAEAELARVLPVIAAIKAQYPELPVAIDTYKLPVMQKAVAAGVDIVNDVNAFTDDPAKLQLMGASQVGLVTMHSNRDGEYADLTAGVNDFFNDNLLALTAAGIDRGRIALDQGIGYAKVADGAQDFAMMRNIDQLNHFNRPLMVAISRKGFGARLFDLRKADRLPVSLVVETAMMLRGGNIIRVHDVEETRQLVKMLQVIEGGYW